MPKRDFTRLKVCFMELLVKRKQLDISLTYRNNETFKKPASCSPPPYWSILYLPVTFVPLSPNPFHDLTAKLLSGWNLPPGTDASTLVLAHEGSVLQLWPLPLALRLPWTVQWWYLKVSLSCLVSSLEAINCQTSEIIFNIFLCMTNLLKFLLSLENSLRSFDTVRI